MPQIASKRGTVSVNIHSAELSSLLLSVSETPHNS